MQWKQLADVGLDSVEPLVDPFLEPAQAFVDRLDLDFYPPCAPMSPVGASAMLFIADSTLASRALCSLAQGPAEHAAQR